MVWTGSQVPKTMESGMNLRAFYIVLLLASSLLAQGLPAAQQTASIVESKESFALGSKHLAVEFSTTRPQLLRLSVDILGLGRFQPSSLRPPAPTPRPTVSRRTGTNVEYRRQGLPGSASARWTFHLGDQGLTLVSRWSEDDPPEPVVLEFDPHLCHATLLGRINSDGSVQLPAILHFPDQGTLRITATDSKDGTLGYDARRAGTGYVRITFPRPPAGGGRLSIAGKLPRFIRVADNCRRSPLRRVPPQLAQYPAIESASAGVGQSCWQRQRRLLLLRIRRHRPVLAAAG